MVAILNNHTLAVLAAGAVLMQSACVVTALPVDALPQIASVMDTASTTNSPAATLPGEPFLGTSFQVIPAIVDPNPQIVVVDTPSTAGGLPALPAVLPAVANATTGGTGPSSDDVRKNLILQTEKLGTAVVQFLATGGTNPASLITFVDGVVSLILGFALGGGPDPMKQFQLDVDNRLAQISQDLAQMETSINEILTVTNAITIQLDDDALQQTLREMATGPLSVIESAYETFTSYASTIANSTANGGGLVNQDAVNTMYKYLSNDPSVGMAYGPNNVYVAMNQLAEFVLGDAGANTGVLGYLPRFVEDQWKACVNQQSGANDLSAQLRDGQGPFIDSPKLIMNDCVAQTFSTLSSFTPSGSKVTGTSMSMQAIAGKILAAQLKGLTVLMAAWGSDPINQPRLVKYVMPNIHATGKTLAGMWSALVVPNEVNSYAYSLLNSYGGKLSVGRQNQAWLLYRDNWVCADCDFYNNIGIASQPQIQNPVVYVTGSCTDPSAQFGPTNNKYPCLVPIPGDVSNGIQNNAAIPFKFGMAGGPNGIVEYYYRLDGVVNVPSAVTAIPPMPKWLQVITDNYASNSTANN